MKTEELREKLEAKERDDQLRTEALISRILDLKTLDRWNVESFVGTLEK